MTTAIPLAKYFKHALDRQARQMATDPQTVQIRVQEALIAILFDEGLLEKLTRAHPEEMRKYCNDFFSVDPDDLDHDVIISYIAISNESLVGAIFAELYQIQELISKQPEVLA